MTQLSRLGNVSLDYQSKADAFEGVLTAAAEAEAEYRSKRAGRVLRAQAEEPKCSHARAETIADADEEIAELHRTKLITAAKADAHRAKLNQLREQNSNGRSFVVSEREVDKMHAEGTGGAA